MNLWENKFQDALHPNNSWGPSRIKEKTEWQIHCEDFDIYYWLPKCIRYEKSWIFTKGLERKAEFWPILKYLSCTCLVCKYAHLTLLKLNSKTKLLMADVLVKKVYWLRPQRTRKEIVEETDDDNDIVKLCVHFCVCVSKSLRKWTQTDTKVTFHPPSAFTYL